MDLRGQGPDPVQRPGGLVSEVLIETGADARTMVKAIIYRYRTGIAWRDLPTAFGPWQTVWIWHPRMASDGTWDNVMGRLMKKADVSGRVDWSLSVDSTIARAHQHATNLTRDTGGWIELHESAGSARGAA